jgi:transposase
VGHRHFARRSFPNALRVTGAPKFRNSSNTSSNHGPKVVTTLHNSAARSRSKATPARQAYCAISFAAARKGNGPQPRKKPPSPRTLAFWLAKPDTERTQEQESWAGAVTKACPEADTAEILAHEFREQLIVTGSATGLTDWLRLAEESNIVEFHGLALSIQRDYKAVVAAFEYPWSNGQAERHVHRLKALKRQMYGRAGFNLLRSRGLIQMPSRRTRTAKRRDVFIKIAGDLVLSRC